MVENKREYYMVVCAQATQLFYYIPLHTSITYLNYIHVHTSIIYHYIPQLHTSTYLNYIPLHTSITYLNIPQLYFITSECFSVFADVVESKFYYKHQFLFIYSRSRSENFQIKLVK